MIMNLLLTSVIIFASPRQGVRPDINIACPLYLPGTNVLVPPGIVYRYSKSEKKKNQLRCYCETVKPLEEACINAGFNRQECIDRTARWIEEIFLVEDRTLMNKRNFLLNLQVNP